MSLNQLMVESTTRLEPPADTLISHVEPGEVSADKQCYFSHFFKLYRNEFTFKGDSRIKEIEKQLKKGVNPNKDCSFQLIEHRNKKLAWMGCKERRTFLSPLDYAIKNNSLPLVKLLVQ